MEKWPNLATLPKSMAKSSWIWAKSKCTGCSKMNLYFVQFWVFRLGRGVNREKKIILRTLGTKKANIIREGLHWKKSVKFNTRGLDKFETFSHLFFTNLCKSAKKSICCLWGEGVPPDVKKIFIGFTLFGVGCLDQKCEISHLSPLILFF